MGKKKGRVIVLNQPDGSVVLGEVVDHSGLGLALRRPILLRQHPLIDGLTVKKYNQFTVSKKDPVYFNPALIVSHYWGDKIISQFYWRISKMYQTETLNFSMIAPRESPARPEGLSADSIVSAINEPDTELPDFEELRSATSRLKE